MLFRGCIPGSARLVQVLGWRLHAAGFLNPCSCMCRDVGFVAFDIFLEVTGECRGLPGGVLGNLVFLTVRWCNIVCLWVWGWFVYTLMLVGVERLRLVI